MIHRPLLTVGFACGALLSPWSKLHAQAAFDSGSNGSMGALNVGTSVTRTIVVPPDGVLHYTTVTVNTNSTINFVRNSANTPVYLLAQGDVILEGVWNLNGQSITTQQRGGVGGPGGFNGGNGGPIPGDGLGPGGGKGGWIDATVPNKPDFMPYRGAGSYRTQGDNSLTLASRGALYGNPLLLPIVGGSGGGGGTGPAPTDYVGGGGGGGAIVIASNTRIQCNWVASIYNTPYFNVSGGTGRNNWAGGSGGAVRLVAPVVTGQARFNVRPGGDDTMGGYGRIRVDTTRPGEFTSVGEGRSNEFITFGSNMVVFPPNPPAVRVVDAAGQAIALDRIDPVFVLLPVGSVATQTLRVRVENFGTVVPLRATITPENGDRGTFDFEIDNTAGGATEGTVEVQIPPGVSSRVDVWTR